MNRQRFKLLIESIVEEILKEAEEEAPPADDSTPDTDAGGLDLSSPDPSGAPADSGSTDASSADGLDLESEDTPEDASGLDSGGGGFGGLGGGGSFGGGPSSGGDSGGDASAEPAKSEGPEGMTQDATPEDPVTSTVEMAIKLSGETGDPQNVLNAVKHNVQKYFSDSDDATEIVFGLWDTGDPSLQSVAYKLLMYIEGD
jgi:hypothetical protein